MSGNKLRPAPRRRIGEALVCLGLIVSAPAAERPCESFATDPLAEGRFVSQTTGTESRFRWDGPSQRLEATLDVDAGAAHFLSSPMGPFTEAADCSFSVAFRVEGLDDQFSPTAAIGLMTLQQHVGDGGNGLVLVLSATNGTLVAAATVEPPGVAPSVGGDPVRLEPAHAYAAVARYRAAKRELSLEVFDGAGFTNLVGFSLAKVPEGTLLRLDRLGLQNAGARRGADPDVGSLTLSVDDLCTPAEYPNVLALSPTERTVAEGHSGARLVDFAVTLSPASSQEITVDYRVSSLTARPGADFALPDGQLEGTLVFAPGVPSVGLSLGVLGDLVDEEDESVRIELGNPRGGTLGASTATLVIVDDDDAPGVSVTGGSVFEGDSGTTNAVFEVVVMGASEKAASLRYRTQPGSASEGLDYLSVSNHWVLPSGGLANNVRFTNSITVPVMGDRVNESVGERTTEDFLLLLDEAVHFRLLSAQATGVIIDDDAERLLWIDNTPTVVEGPRGTEANLVFDVRLSRAATVPVQFGVSTLGGTASEEVDFRRLSASFSLPPNTTLIPVTVKVIGDDVPEEDESLELILRDVVADIPIRIPADKGRARGWIRSEDPFPRLRVADVSVLEGNAGQFTDAVFVVALDPPVSYPVSVRSATAAGTAAEGTDYRASSDTLVFPRDTGVREIVVSVLGDSLDEEDPERFLLNLSQAEGAIIVDGQGEGAIRDDDPLPRLRIEGAAVVEGPTGSKEVLLAVTLNSPSGRDVQVTCTTEDGTARAAAGDYQQASQTLTFRAAAAETRKYVRILVQGDRTYETDEQFCVRLSQPVNGQIEVPRACVIITNDDDPPVLSVANVVVNEGQSGATEAVLTLRLSAASELPVSLEYQTSDGTARAGADYQAINPTALRFGPAETSKPVAVRVLGDLVDEDDETFVLRMFNVVNATPKSLEARGTILNDDLAFLRIEDVLPVPEGNAGVTPATFRVTLTTPSSRDVSFDFGTADGTALADRDYRPVTDHRTITSLSTTALIPVDVIGDRSIELDEVFHLDVSNVSGARGIQRARGECTILDDDTPVGELPERVEVVEGNAGTTTNAVIPLRLSWSVPEEITFTYRTRGGGSASAGVDYVPTNRLIRLAAGQLSTNLLVTTLGDNAVEPDETALVEFVSATNVRLTRTVVTNVILNDDLPPPALGGPATVSVLEGHTGQFPKANLLLALSRPAPADVTFTYQTRDGTATGGVDFVAATNTVRIPSGGQTATVEITVLGDLNVELDETFVVELLNPVNATFSQNRVTVTILNDDFHPVLLFPAAVSVVEGDAGEFPRATVPLHLDKAAPVDVSFTYRTRNGSATDRVDYLPATNTLRIAAGGRATNLEVTVVGDDRVELDETLLVEFLNPVNVVLSGASSTVTIQDDDLGLAILSMGLLAENCRPANGAIDPLETVTVSLTLTNASHLPLSDVRLKLIADAAIRPTSDTVVYGEMPGHGPAVTRTFTLQTLGVCDQSVCARWEVRDGTTPVTTLSHCFALGWKPDGALACCVPVDLRLEAAGQPEPVTLGSRLVFAVAVTNAGPQAATAVAVTNRLADLLHFQFATPSRGSIAIRGGLWVWDVGRLEPDTGARLSLEVIAGSFAEVTVLPQTITSYFSVGSDENEQSPADNIVPVTTRIEPPAGFSVNSVAVVEGDAGSVTNALFKVWRWARTPNELASTVNVTCRTQDGTALAPDDYIANLTQLTFGPGVTVREFAVAVRGDNVPEETETFAVVLTNPTGNLPIHGPGLGTIRDDDLAVLSVHEASVIEGDTAQTTFLAFDVALSGIPKQAVSVHVEVADGTATVGDRDYIATPTNLVWSIGQSQTQTVRVPVIGDDRFEPDETVRVRLTQVVGATSLLSEAVGTIVNNDARPMTISMAAAEVLEGGPGETSVMRFPVRLSYANSRVVGVDYYTLDGSAVAPEDYQAVTNHLEFPPGVIEADALVRVNGDVLREPNETFRVVLANALEATILPGQGVATGTILDDEPIHELLADGYEVVAENCLPGNRAVDPLERVTLQLFLKNSGRTAATNLVATLLGGAAGEVRILPATTTAAYGRIGIGQRIGKPFELQVDGACGATFELELQLQDQGVVVGRAHFPLRLGTIVNGGPACCLQADLAVESLVPAESLVGLPVTLTNVVSNLGPSLSTGIRLQVRLPEAATLASIVASGGTGSVSGTMVTCDLEPLPPQASSTVLITVTNLPVAEHQFIAVVAGTELDPETGNDAAVARVRVVPPPDFSVSDIAGWEGTNALVTVRLNPARANLSTSVTLSTADGTALAAKGDYVPLTTNLVFQPRETARTLLIRTLGDDEDEADEHYIVRLSNPVGAPISVPEARVWILDTNIPCLRIGEIEVNVGLKGQAVVFVPVWLSSASRTNITVHFATRNGLATGGPDFEHREGWLTFPAGTTNQQEIRLVISGNTLDEGREHFFVDLGQPTGATLCKPTGTIAITDLDPVELTVQDVSVVEGDPGQTSEARFVLRLAAPLPNNAFVEVYTASGTALPDRDYRTLATNTVMFLTNEVERVVSVPILGDLEPEPTEFFTLHLRKPQNVILERDQATATIMDDDVPPTITIKSPLSGATFPASAEIPILAEAVDPDGTVKTVAFWWNTNALPVVAAPLSDGPWKGLWEAVWRNAPPGEHVLTALAVDNDGLSSTSAPVSISVTTPPTNTPPVISAIADQTILEDGDGATDFTVWDAETPATNLLVTASSWNPKLLPPEGLALSGINTNRLLSFKPTADEFGDGWVLVTVDDRQHTVGELFKLTVLPVNDPPSFLPGSEAVVLEDSGLTVITNWATALKTGPANESDQQLMPFRVSTTPTSLFAAPPTIDAGGTLRFVPATDAFGTNLVTVVLQDTGGTEHGGVDAVTNAVTVRVLAVNDPPTLDPIADRTHPVNALPEAIRLTGITTGAANEAQNLHLSAVSDNPSLVEPTIAYSSPAVTGTLSYQPKPGQSGVATIAVSVKDDGGAANGGSDSFQRQFQVTIQSNLPPTVRLTAPTNGQVFPVGTNIVLRAIATDLDGRLTNVAFFTSSTGFLGRGLLDPQTTDAYQFTWSGAPVGEYELHARATDNNGAETRSPSVNIIVRTNLGLTLTSPVDDATYCPGAPMVFAATVQGAVPAGSVVEFHGPDGLLETATSAPFAVLQRDGLPAGAYELQARLMDGGGTLRAVSLTNSFTVLEVCGDVAILQNYADAAVTNMESLFYDERMLPHVRNGVHVFGQGEVGLARLLGYKLIIWAGLDRVGEGLTDPDVQLLEDLRAAGKSLYLLGLHVADDTGLLSVPGLEQWEQLAGVRPLGPVVTPATVLAHPSGYGDPIFQTTPGGFVIPPASFVVSAAQPLELLASHDFQVKLTVNDAPVMAVTPPVCDLDVGQVRLAVQSFGLEDVVASQNLFKNTALWLLRGWYCENLELQLEALDGPAQGCAHEELVYAYFVEHSGACGAAGVTLREELPAGWQVVAVESPGGSWEQVGPFVFVNLGCLDQSQRHEVRLHLRATQPGTFDHVVEVRAEAEAFKVEKHRRVVTTEIESCAIAPRLELRRSGLTHLVLWLFGASDRVYRIEESRDLRGWQDLGTLTGPEAQMPITLPEGPGGGPRFFRALWP